jgi:hypothetical protein
MCRWPHARIVATVLTLTAWTSDGTAGTRSEATKTNLGRLASLPRPEAITETAGQHHAAAG